MESMDAVVVENIGNVICKKIPFPQCGDNDVIVRTERSGICSTDVIRSMKTGFYHYPIVPGHEFCGVVVQKGKNVTNAGIDERVVVYPLIPCKKCVSCTKGDFNLCETYDFLGSRSNGGHEEYVKCPAENLIKIPDGVSFDEASMTEPASVGLHANKVSGRGENVVIMGLGPIGFFTAQWAKIFGAKKVIVVDRNKHRFDIGMKVGIDEFVNSKEVNVSQTIKDLTGGMGADIVFECSGAEDLQKESIAAAAKHGKVVILGNPLKELLISKEHYSMILRRELSVMGSWSSLISTKEWDESLKHMQNGGLKAAPVITHDFHINDAKTVIGDMYNKKFEFSRVVFR